MQWLKNFMERIKNTWSNMTSGKRIALISIGVAFVVSLTMYYFVFAKTTYVPLFSDLSVTDSAKIVQKLDELGTTDYKIEAGGTTISVPEEKVDRLRIDLANDGALPTSNSGFELFDEAGFALTSEERQIMYQRALQGELQRAIMSLEEVDFANVILSMPEESLFSDEDKSGSASVLVKLNVFKQLDPEKVRGIIALVSGAVKGIPPENVQVIDTELNYLSFGVNEEEDYNSIQETGNRMSLKEAFENELASDIQQMLETALGKGKVVVQINAQMNFDAEEKTIISYNDMPIIRSIQERITIEGGEDANFSLSPVDNNIQYYGENTDEIADINGLEDYENIRNYEIGETTIHTIKAPGEVTKLSTSVIYDGELSGERKEAIENIVMAAVGYNESRGDIISVEGMVFDRTAEVELKKAMNEAEEAYLQEQQKQMLIKYVSIGVGSLVFLIFLIIILVRMRKARKNQEAQLQQQVNPVPIEEMIQDISSKLNVKDEVGIEQEIMEYAQGSPEKVADIVRTWILKDEV